MATHVEAISLRTSGKVVVADFTRGELKDEKEILKLLNKLAQLVEKRKNVNLLLNMSNVSYISSSGLGAIVSLFKKVARQGGVMKICGLQDMVREVFDVMHLNRVIPIFDTEEEALASF